MSTYELTGKTVLISGAAGGIGRATARALHDRGANLMLCDLEQDAVDATLADLGGADAAVGAAVDVTDRSALDAAVSLAVERFGTIDVVFANAGIAVDPPTTIARVEETQFERVIEVDLLGVWRTVRAALPHVIAARGYVLVTASVYAYVNGMLNAAYAVSKAGVEQFGRALRSELAGHGASAGVLYPGWVDTPIARAAFNPLESTSWLVEQMFPAPLRRAIGAEQVATAIVRGIERRSPRIIVPSRWTAISLLRGLVNVLTDVQLERRPAIRNAVMEIERRFTSE